ncbi:hypothetical protein D3C79_1101080 [compost metagenome]
MQGLRVEVGNAGLLQALDHALQRQVVDVQRAADVRGEHAGQIAGRYVSGFPRDAAIHP